MNKRLVASLAAITLASAAHAHTHLTSATPADGSNVTSAPSEFALKFTEAARLTALTITRDDGKEVKITPLPAKAAAQIKVAAPKLENGHYTLNWRVVGSDGHVMTGKLGFTVGGKPSAGSGDHANPTGH